MSETFSIVYDNQPAQQVASAVNSFVAGMARQPLLFLVAGGSVLQEVVPLLAPDVFQDSAVVSVFDERCTTEPAGQNQRLLQETSWYQAALGRGVTLLSVAQGSEFDCATSAQQWEDALHEWRAAHPHGRVVALVGIGVDGHIAGIMPETETDDTPGSWVQVCQYDASQQEYPVRITPTYVFLETVVDQYFLYVQGAAKQAALAALFAPEGTRAQTPARVLRDHPKVIVYTDIDIVS